MKSFSHNRPETIQKVGDGSHYYNYGIKEVPQEPEEEGGATPASLFEYESVRVFGELSHENITKAVLRERRNEAEELDLVNRYNSYVLGISSNEQDQIGYEDYLQEIQDTRAMVLADLEALEENE